MPTRSKKPCSCPGCPVLTSERWCETHAKNKFISRSYDQLRGNSTQRGYDSLWKKLRLVALRRDNYLCAHCMKFDGRPIQATDVDHIVPIAEAPERRLDLDNLQCLCKKHHDQKTYEENNAFGRSTQERVQ
jgi:5-methylcytosine-specific restriction enzyme A